jgi:hypothetical protein
MDTLEPVYHYSASFAFTHASGLFNKLLQACHIHMKIMINGINPVKFKYPNNQTFWVSLQYQATDAPWLIRKAFDRLKLFSTEAAPLVFNDLGTEGSYVCTTPEFKTGIVVMLNQDWDNLLVTISDSNKWSLRSLLLNNTRLVATPVREQLHMETIHETSKLQGLHTQ